MTLSILRLAWRELRAARARSLLVVALVAIAVAAAVVVAVGSRSLAPTAQERMAERFGAADLVVSVHHEGESYDKLPPTLQAEVDRILGGPVGQLQPEDVEAALDELAPRRPRARVDQGSFLLRERWVELWVADPADPLLSGVLNTSVRSPIAGDEVLLSRPLLAALDAQVGDEIRLPGLGTRRVAGMVATLGRGRQPLAVVSPDHLPAPLLNTFHTRWFVGGLTESEAVDLASRLPGRAELIAAARVPDAPAPRGDLGAGGLWTDVRHRDEAALLAGLHESPPHHTVLGGFVALVLLVIVGFVTTAALATGSRRRIRELGLLTAAAGAAPGHVRGVVLGQGLVLGILGGFVGVAAGATTAAISTPVLQRLGPRLDVSLVWHPADLLTPALLAVAVSLVAAWWPGRAAAQVPVVTALAGRVQERPVPLRASPVAIVVSLLGAALIVLASRLESGNWAVTSEHYTSARTVTAGWLTPQVTTLLRGVGIAVGVALLLGGGAGLAAPVLQASSQLARRVGLVGRLALRDSARQRTRSVAAVSATMAVFAVAVGILALAAGGDRAAAQHRAVQRDDVVLVAGPTYGGLALSPTADMVAAVAAGLPAVERKVDVSVILSPAAWDARWVALSAAPRAGADGDPVAPEWMVSVTGVGVADPAVLDLLGVPAVPPGSVVIDPRLLDQHAGNVHDAVSAPALVAIERDGRVPATVETGAIEVEVIVAARSLGWEAPELWLAPDIAARLGEPATSRMVVLQTPGPLPASAAQALTLTARTHAQPFRVAVPPEEPVGGRRLALAWAGGAAVLLAALTAVLVAALAATETDQDLRRAAALGADPRLRPRLRALQAAYHALVAVLLAVPVGLLLALAVGRAGTLAAALAVPWPEIAVLVVAAPLLVALPLWLGSRRLDVRATARRPT